MKTTIKFGGYQGDNSVHTRAARVFADTLKQATDGAVEVDFTQNIVEQGAKAADLLNRTESGALDGCYFSSSYLAGRVPELGLFDQHFVVPTRQHAYAILDGALGSRLAGEVAQRTGYTVLGYWDNGLRHISSGRGPIRRPEDCRGLKIRTLANDHHQRVFRQLGFEPIAIDVLDLPAAVADFRVDAQENPLTNTYNFALHQTHRHITLTSHLLGVALVLFNQHSVNTWSDDVRNAVEQALATATTEQRRLAMEEDAICSQAMVAEGCELISLNDNERTEFILATRATVEATRAKFDQEFIKLFEADLATVD